MYTAMANINKQTTHNYKLIYAIIVLLCVIIVFLCIQNSNTRIILTTNEHHVPRLQSFIHGEVTQQSKQIAALLQQTKTQSETNPIALHVDVNTLKSMSAIGYEPFTSELLFNSNVKLSEGEILKEYSCLLSMDKLPSFLALAEEFHTDKAGSTPLSHRYDLAYEPLFNRYRCNPRIRFLEFGIGCGYQTEGASIPVWSKFFAKGAELHFVDFDSACVQRNQQRFPQHKFHVADQSDVSSLQKLIKESTEDEKKLFHFIVDDGGHADNHQQNSFNELFPKALLPGGYFVTEDLQVSYDGQTQNTNAFRASNYDRTMSVVKSKIDYLARGTWLPAVDRPLLMPPTSSWTNVKSIQCFPELCVMAKYNVKELVRKL
jgi:hypothetical protein